MANTAVVDAIIALLSDEDFRALRERSERLNLSWDEFRQERMPSGYAPEQVWDILSTIRRQTARVYDFPSYLFEDGPDIWCAVNGYVGFLVTSISLESRQVEPVFRQSGPLAPPFAGLVAADVAAAADRDGLSIGMGTVRALVSGREPLNVAERVVSRALSILADIAKGPRRKVTVWALREFADLLDDEATDLPGRRAEPISPAKRLFRHLSDDEYVERLCAMLRGSLAPGRREPLVDAAAFSFAMWDLAPLPKWNGLVELLARHMHLVDIGEPSLACIPVSAHALEWESRANRKDQYSYRRLGPTDPRDGDDWTVHVTNQLEWVHGQLGALEERMRRAEGSLDAAVTSIESHDELNHRQKALLVQAVRSGGTFSCDIKTYMEGQRVAYGTARSDLLVLVDMGFLTVEVEGRAMRFRSSPSLWRKIQSVPGSTAE